MSVNINTNKEITKYTTDAVGNINAVWIDGEKLENSGLVFDTPETALSPFTPSDDPTDYPPILLIEDFTEKHYQKMFFDIAPNAFYAWKLKKSFTLNESGEWEEDETPVFKDLDDNSWDMIFHRGLGGNGYGSIVDLDNKVYMFDSTSGDDPSEIDENCKPLLISNPLVLSEGYDEGDLVISWEKSHWIDDILEPSTEYPEGVAPFAAVFFVLNTYEIQSGVVPSKLIKRSVFELDFDYTVSF